MGQNIAKENVIGLRTERDRYTSFIDPVNGVFGAAEFTNDIYKGEIPVEKVWEDGVENHTLDHIYIVLYKDDVPVLDDNQRARLLRLDISNQWQGSFEVVILDKDDKVSDYNYSVREVSAVSVEKQNGWYAAVLENDGISLMYYEKALENSDFTWIESKGYVVQYQSNENGGWVVTNLPAVELPMTGGIGTQRYTISGLLILAAGLIYGYSQRRKRERRARD